MTERPARSLATIPCGETTVLAISKPLPSPKAKQGDSFPPWRYKYHIPSHPILLSLSFPHPLSFHSIRILNQTFLPVSPSTLLSSSASQCISLSPDDPYPHTPLSTELLKVTHTTAIMQFTIVALLSLVAVAFAGPIAMPQRLDARQVNTEAAAMSDASGNVVAFDSASVYKAATDAGL
ncbi:hypothetical protein BKA64DRAFT_332539 [Cadophora sp. MPI-SDFR-AT-0126]|nr:hypothetical protein BKA64DRAFT_332539 [Leotiomycetes sp. MPI-SDFR-AT-0126]